MTKKEYLEKRSNLLAEAQALLDAGKVDESKAKRLEIEDLDNEMVAITTEQANLAALEKQKPINLANQSLSPQGAVVVGSAKVKEKIDYETVFAKVALQYPLNNEEIEVYNQFNPQNAYTHTTDNTEIVIPTTVLDGIMKNASELHPIVNDVRVLGVKGNVRFIKHDGIEAGDAKYYTDDEVTEDEKNKFGEVVIGGHDLAKAVTVTWKLQSMAVEAFIPFLQQELGERIGAAKAAAIIKGSGTKQPKGILTVLKAQDGKPQVVSYAASVTYQEITKAMGKIASAFIGGVKVYVNNSTLWNELANIMNKENRPIFVADPILGGVGRVFGKVVEVEDALADGEILIGNCKKGYVMNIQEQMKLVTEQHAKARTTDFVGYEVNDGNVIAEKAFALIGKNVG